MLGTGVVVTMELKVTLLAEMNVRCAQTGVEAAQSTPGQAPTRSAGDGANAGGKRKSVQGGTGNVDHVAVIEVGDADGSLLVGPDCLVIHQRAVTTVSTRN